MVKKKLPETPIPPNQRGWKPKKNAVFARNPESDRQRVNIRPEKFDLLIKQQGIRVKVFRTVFCPNVKSIDGAEHNIDCKICNGSGFLDLEPICSLAIVTNQELNVENLPEGLLDSNVITATFERGIELQYFTLVELQDFTEPFFERIKRSTGDVDRLKYSCQRPNVIIDARGRRYECDNDFRLTEDGDIQWKSGKGPTPGDIYSIHYEAKVQYRAIRAMKTNRFVQAVRDAGDVEHVKMSEYWMLQKEFLVKRKDALGNELLPNPINDSEE